LRPCPPGGNSIKTKIKTKKKLYKKIGNHQPNLLICHSHWPPSGFPVTFFFISSKGGVN